MTEFSIHLWKVFQAFLLIFEQHDRRGANLWENKKVLMKTLLKHLWQQHSLQIMTSFFLVNFPSIKYYFSHCSHLKQTIFRNKNHIFFFPFNSCHLSLNMHFLLRKHFFKSYRLKILNSFHSRPVPKPLANTPTADCAV